MPRVLLVDDSPVALHLLAHGVQAKGIAVRQASSVGAAQGMTPEELGGLAGAVLDIDLGDGNGVDLAVWLRAAHPALPIAFFTGEASSQLAERARRLGPVFGKNDVEPVLAWVGAVCGGQPPPTK
jgi:DNA-binding response OmpR family regulator